MAHTMLWTQVANPLCHPCMVWFAGPLFAMPEATTFFMSRDPTDSLDLYGFKKPHNSLEEGQGGAREAEPTFETVPFDETTGL